MSEKSRGRWSLPKFVRSASVATAMLAAEAGLDSANAEDAKPDAPPARAHDRAAPQEVMRLITRIEKDLKEDEAKASESDKEKIAGYIKAMGDDEFPVREKASEALKVMGHKAEPQLQEAEKNNPDLEIRARAHRVLQILAWQKNERTKRYTDATPRIGSWKADAKPAVPILIKLLAHPDAKVQDAATAALGDIGPGAAAAVGPLCKRLKHSDATSETWRNTALALGNIGEAAAKDAEPVFLKILRDTAPGSQPDLIVIEALGGIRSEKAIDDLIEIIDHINNSYIIAAVAPALGKIGKQPEKIIPALGRCCKDQAENARKAGFEALLEYKSETALVVPVLIAILKEGHIDLVLPSIKALAGMGKAAAPAKAALEKIRDFQPTEQDIDRWGKKAIEENRRSAIKALEAIDPGHKR